MIMISYIKVTTQAEGMRSEPHLRREEEYLAGLVRVCHAAGSGEQIIDGIYQGPALR